MSQHNGRHPEPPAAPRRDEAPRFEPASPSPPSIAGSAIPRSYASLDRSREISLAHGGGGQLTDALLRQSIVPRLDRGLLGSLLDSATLASFGRDRPALTIDGYVVTPWRFPGGNIGHLAVCGTVNDLAVAGAIPQGIALSLILEEGFPRRHLEAVIEAVAEAADAAGVSVITGDTKVVGRGAGDGLYLVTAGLGRVPAGRELGPERLRPGDVLLLSGAVGEHGLAVMLAREMPEVESVLRSDCAPLNHLAEAILAAGGQDVAFMRDATRGGLAGLAADLAEASGCLVELEESAIPIDPSAWHAAEMLGLDPLEVANEGKLLVALRPAAAERVLAAMRDLPVAARAAAIGRLVEAPDGRPRCELITPVGGRRVLQKPYGEQLPRIC
ncbi:MAG: hydrogenase expression/formation protein HypE [Chloroflexi bacterium]|nr:hydrogenase expression/formation protein HypE [Chloroflexota bacterium]